MTVTENPFISALMNTDVYVGLFIRDNWVRQYFFLRYQKYNSRQL